MQPRDDIYLGVAAALLFSLAITWDYLSTPGLKIYLDNKRNEDIFSGLPFIISLSEALRKGGICHYTWNTMFSEPLFVADSGFYYFLHFVLYLLTGTYVSYKIHIFILLIVAFFSMYVLTRSFARETRRFSAVAAGIFYSMSPFFLFELIGHEYMMWSYALLPLTYVFGYKALTRKGLRWTMLGGLTIALCMFYPAIYYVYVVGIPFLIFWAVFLFLEPTGIVSVLRGFLRLFSMFAIAFALSAYFIVPMFGPPGPYSIAFVHLRSEPPVAHSLSLIEAIFLIGSGMRADLGLNYFTEFGASFIPFASILIFASTILLLRFSASPSRAALQAFFCAGVVSLLFSMGTKAPYPLNILDYARSLPFFEQLRVPSRFMNTSCLSFAFLAAIAVGGAARRMPSATACRLDLYCHRMYRVILVVVFISCYLFSSYRIAYSVAGPFETQGVPEISSVVAWLSHADPNDEYRIVDLTRDTLMTAYHRSIVRVSTDIVSRYYRSPSFAKLLSLLNVKYVIVSRDSSFPMDIGPVLSSSRDFDSVKIGEVTVYINKLAKPRLYLADGALLIGGLSGLSLFYSLSDASLTGREWVLFDPSVLTDDQIKKFELIVFHDSDMLDLAFLGLDSSYKIEAWKYADKHWVIVEDHHGSQIPSAPYYQSSIRGQLIFSENAVFTKERATLEIPTRVRTGGAYDIWVRASNARATDPRRDIRPTSVVSNTLCVSIDAKANYVDLAEIGGFRWIRVNTLNLGEGEHILRLLTCGRPTYVDMVLVVPTELIPDLLIREEARIDRLPHLYLMEFSNYFAQKNTIQSSDTASYCSDTWSGYLEVGFGSELTQKVFIAKDGVYRFGIRALQMVKNGRLSIRIDDHEFGESFAFIDGTWSWSQPVPVFLRHGEHRIGISGVVGRWGVDALYLMETGYESVRNGSSEVEYVENWPYTWKGTIRSERTRFVILTESFYPEWPMSVLRGYNKHELKSIRALYLLNAYYVNTAGETQFIIEHRTSTLRIASFAISILAACIVAGAFATEILLERSVTRASKRRKNTDLKKQWPK